MSVRESVSQDLASQCQLIPWERTENGKIISKHFCHSAGPLYVPTNFPDVTADRRNLDWLQTHQIPVSLTYRDTLAVDTVHDPEGGAEVGMPRLLQLVRLPTKPAF